MGIHYLKFGRRANDPTTVVWRVHDEMRASETLLFGELSEVPRTLAGWAIEDLLRLKLMKEHHSLWEQIGLYSEAVRPPVTPQCGRLFCPNSKRHSHRVWKPGDVLALTSMDPADRTRAEWPFPHWGVVGVRDEDDAYEDGICVEIGSERTRVFRKPTDIRRLEPDELVIGVSSW